MKVEKLKPFDWTSMRRAIEHGSGPAINKQPTTNTDTPLPSDTYWSDVSASSKQERVNTTRMAVQELGNIIDLKAIAGRQDGDQGIGDRLDMNQ